MGEKSFVIHVPQAGGIVCHGVDGPLDVGNFGIVAVVPLMETLCETHVSSTVLGGEGSLPGP